MYQLILSPLRFMAGQEYMYTQVYLSHVDEIFGNLFCNVMSPLVERNQWY